MADREGPAAYAASETMERMARSLNDDWAAGSQGTRWDQLDESEREHWRRVARAVMGTPAAVLNEEEQAVMDHILAAMAGIHALGLRANATELASAVHVLQSFVIQHMLQRLAPEEWNQWFEEATDGR